MLMDLYLKHYETGFSCNDQSNHMSCHMQNYDISDHYVFM